MNRPPLPRFHGAWALLGAALVPGLALSTPDPARWALAGSILFAFLASASLEPGGVSTRDRKSLAAWVSGYAIAGAILMLLAARGLALAPLLLPALAGLGLGAIRLRPPVRELGRPIAREVLGMSLLGLALPVLLLAGGAALRTAAALYALYLGFFGLRLAFVRALLAGRARGAISFRYPIQAAVVAAALWIVAIAALGLRPLALCVLLPVLGVGFLRLLGDRRAERSIRAAGIEELLSAIAFVIGLLALGERHLAG